MIKSLQKYVRHEHCITGDAAGLHLVAEFPGIHFTEGLIERLDKHGVRVNPVEAHAIVKGKHCHKVFFGYGHLRTEEIVEGVRKFAEVISGVERQVMNRPAHSKV